MKIGMIKAKNPAPESKINSNAVLKGIGLSLIHISEPTRH